MVAPNFESVGFVEFTRKTLAAAMKSTGIPAHLVDVDPPSCNAVTFGGIVIGQLKSIEWGALLKRSRTDQNYRDN